MRQATINLHLGRQTLTVDLTYAHHEACRATRDYPGDPEWREVQTVSVQRFNEIARHQRPDWFAAIDRMLASKLAGFDISHLLHH